MQCTYYSPGNREMTQWAYEAVAYALKSIICKNRTIKPYASVQD